MSSDKFNPRRQTGLHIQIWAIGIIDKEHIRRDIRQFYSVKIYNNLMEVEKTEFCTVVSEFRQNLTETLKELDKLDQLYHNTDNHEEQRLWYILEFAAVGPTYQHCSNQLTKWGRLNNWDSEIERLRDRLTKLKIQAEHHDK